MDKLIKRQHPSQTILHLVPGVTVEYEGRTVKFLDAVSLNSAVVHDDSSGQTIKVFIKDLKPRSKSTVQEAGQHATRDYAAFTDQEWQECERRFQIIEPLISAPSRGKAHVQAVAKESGFSVASIYKMLRSYEDSRSKSSLLPNRRGRKRGTTLLDPVVDALIASSIESIYLTEQKNNVSAVHRHVKMMCQSKGLPVPTLNTVALRVRRLDPASSIRARSSDSEADHKLGQVKTGTPTAERALDFVQIDHTRADIIVVDEVDRLPIGRPWITVAIDVKTRCILGVYLSLDDPSYVAVGSVLSNMLLTKFDYLAELELSVEWPMWGRPVKVGADNGPDFRSNYLERALDAYEFGIEWRPLMGTNYGGHIERYLGTFALWVKELPGATFNSPEARGDYDSEATSAFTLKEFEQYVVRHICEIYHKSEHRGLPGNATPYREWERDIYGSPGLPGLGTPLIYGNPDQVRIDFLPVFRRKITRGGVSFKTIPYQKAEVLGPARLAYSDDRKSEQQTLFHNDPRDITRIWMWDDDQGGYQSIPIAIREMPAISLSEYLAIQRLLRKRDEPHDAQAIAHHALVNVALTEESQKRTKTARKAAEKRRINARKSVRAQNRQTEKVAAAATGPTQFVDEAIQPFDESEGW